ncbi:glycosyltransferase family 2 protein [Microgenomates group bacterium]|nr:glycosyltransferase family 2 protein [Microgenomates group bacterium]
MSRLSVVMNVKNGAKYLEKSLASIENIADEIVVVDMASTDETLAIAKKFKAKIYQYPEPEIGNVEMAREWSFNKVQGEWILLLDCDEEISLPLAELIKRIVRGEEEVVKKADAYYLARKNIIWDKVITRANWWPDYQLRLWKKGKISWPRVLHPQPKVLGKSGYLPPEEGLTIIHHNYQTIEQFIKKANRYSSYKASERAEQRSVTSRELWDSFWDEFWARAFLHRGIEEGSHGIVLSLLQSSTELMTKAKEWEGQDFTKQSLSTKEMKKMRKAMQKTAAYWWAEVLAGRTKGVEKMYWQIRRKAKI